VACLAAVTTAHQHTAVPCSIGMTWHRPLGTAGNYAAGHAHLTTPLQPNPLAAGCHWVPATATAAALRPWVALQLLLQRHLCSS
jgi:hypothetical protein